MSIPWSDLYSRRQEIHRRWPVLHRVPTVRRAIRVAEPLVTDGVRILSVGGGSNPRAERLAARVANAATTTVDPDPEVHADHPGIEDVEGRFDLALLLEVIEHLSLPDGLDLLRGIRDRLAPDGALVVSTPNVFCPGRFQRDATHVTPYAWDELGAVLSLAGFEVDGLYRVVPGSFFRRIGKALLSPVGRGLGLDHAPSIAALARPLLG